MSGSRRKTTNTASSGHTRDQTLGVTIEDLEALDGAVLQYEIDLIKKHCSELLESILNKK